MFKGNRKVVFRVLGGSLICLRHRCGTRLWVGFERPTRVGQGAAPDVWWRL